MVETGLNRHLVALGDGVGKALDELGVAVYVVDRDGTFRWLNKRAVELVGDVVGQRFTSVVAPHDLHLARRQFARKLLGAVDRTDYDVTIVASDGAHVPMRLTSAPLRDGGGVIGVLGLGVVGECSVAAAAVARAADELTPRQHEVLLLLARGFGTADVAAALGIAEETARNHIRALLRRMRVHSRLEAVAVAKERGLI